MRKVLMLVVPVALVASPVALPSAAAQAQAVSRTGEQCQTERNARRQRGRAIGGMLGGLAGNFGGRAGGVANAVTNFLPVGELLGEAIASMLDCDEQQKAAGATQEVVEQAERGGVGTTVNWESESRPGVRGSSTVTAVETASADGECMTVTDIVIVEGEETRAPKRMCRRPPNNRYVRV